MYQKQNIIRFATGTCFADILTAYNHSIYNLYMLWYNLQLRSLNQH